MNHNLQMEPEMTVLASLKVFSWLIGFAIAITGVFALALILMLLHDWRTGNLW